MITSSLRLSPRIIYDSRGRPTVAVVASQDGHSAEGDVPAGASKGKDEARTVAPEQAVKNIAGPIEKLANAHASSLQRPEGLLAFDAALAKLCGDNFQQLGANAALPVSRALWRLGAQRQKRPLWEFLRMGLRVAPDIREPVRMYMNIFNGGLHAIKSGEQLGRERISLQEIMVVPVSQQSYRDALTTGDRIDAALEQLLLDGYGAEAVGRADEAGFSVRGLGDSHRAIALVKQAIEAAGYVPGVDVKLALDCAAQSFAQEQSDSSTGGIAYQLGESTLSSDEMVAWLLALTRRYSGMFLSIEDGLGEDDWAAWSKLSLALKDEGVVTVGDDLFVTQLPRLRRGIEAKAAGAILIKVNQNGTVGGTLGVIDEAHRAGLKCIVSHRSGETLDDSIADLAVACGALGLKSGDPQPPGAFKDPAQLHRRVKYSRLVAIEAEGAKT